MSVGLWCSGALLSQHPFLLTALFLLFVRRERVRYGGEWSLLRYGSTWRGHVRYTSYLLLYAAMGTALLWTVLKQMEEKGMNLPMTVSSTFLITHMTDCLLLFSYYTTFWFISFDLIHEKQERIVVMWAQSLVLLISLVDFAGLFVLATLQDDLQSAFYLFMEILLSTGRMGHSVSQIYIRITLPRRIMSQLQKGRSLLQQDSCSICLESFTNMGLTLTTLPCLHTFHSPCLQTSLHYQLHCPVCRDNILQEYK